MSPTDSLADKYFSEDSPDRLGREYRPGQHRLAKDIQLVFEEAGLGIFEAPPGVGKTYAYAAMALEYAQRTGERVIISSATKMLQAQLLQDLPFVRGKLGIPEFVERDYENEQGQTVKYKGPFFHVVKGNANYCCRLKAMKKDAPPAFMAWLNTTPTADFSDAPQPILPRILYGASADGCAAKNCPEKDNCVFAANKDRKKYAPVVVVNHALLARDLQFHILGEYKVLVLDEAHEAEAYIRGAFKSELSAKTMDGVMKKVQFLSTNIMPEARRTAIVDMTTQLISELEEKNKVPDSDVWAIQNPCADSAAKLLEEIADAHRAVKHLGEESWEEYLDTRAAEYYEQILESNSADSAVENVRDTLRRLLKIDQEHEVAYLDGQGEYRKLCIEQIEIGALVHELLFSKVPRIICTSATLAQRDRVDPKGQVFEFFRDQVGAWNKNTLMDICPSAFDFEKQARLYAPSDLPEYSYYGEKYDDWVAQLSLRVYELIEASNGGAFILFSSRKDMDKFRRVLDNEDKGTIAGCEYWAQGAGGHQGAEQGLSWFLENPNRIILGLRRFWTGVSVEGDNLRLVIVTKLPFPAPAPLLEARKNLAEKAGENWFGKLMIPGMIAEMKQGTGRLIRTKSDRGVVAILDGRIHTKRYGITLKGALPFRYSARSIDDVKAFLNTRFG